MTRVGLLAKNESAASVAAAGKEESCALRCSHPSATVPPPSAAVQGCAGMQRLTRAPALASALLSSSNKVAALGLEAPAPQQPHGCKWGCPSLWPLRDPGFPHQEARECPRGCVAEEEK